MYEKRNTKTTLGQRAIGKNEKLENSFCNDQVPKDVWFILKGRTKVLYEGKIKAFKWIGSLYFKTVQVWWECWVVCGKSNRWCLQFSLHFKSGRLFWA